MPSAFTHVLGAAVRGAGFRPAVSRISDPPSIGLWQLALGLLLALARPVSGARPTAPVVRVANAAEFRTAVRQATAGARIQLAPGVYPGGFYFPNLRGTAEQPILIEAVNPRQPPVFERGGTGLHLTDPAHVELRNLVIRGATGNGLNIDDGGSFASPARQVVLRHLRVTDVGPGGNHDAIKLSGMVDFQIDHCVIANWGTGGGSGIDMVGCHRGLIVSNVFRHTDTTGSTGIQCKGGTSRITIRQNYFEDAGGRGVNIGGSTGLPYFRPPLADGHAHCEAQAITVEGNTFFGCGAPVAFVGVDGAVVRFNTIYRPRRWAVRILQENRGPGFVPSRNGVFTDNLVVFHSREWSAGGINIGPGTAPATFTFARNWWHCLDRPERSRPRLPVEESDGVYGPAPRLINAADRNYRQRPDSPARDVGADAFRAK